MIRGVEAPRKISRLLLVVVAVFALAVSAAVTGAYLTSERSAPATNSGTASWCAVPDPALNPNVYRLADLTPTDPGTQMIIVPVVNNGDFGAPADRARRLGVRLWSCNTTTAASTSTMIKVSAWRRASGTVAWTQATGSMATRRLDLTTGWGEDAKAYHRVGTGSSRVGFGPRSQYSWLVGAGRTKSAPGTEPDGCATYGLCVIQMDPTPSWSQAFRPEGGTAVPATNAVTYLGTKYWTGAGYWPLLGITNESPLMLEPYAGNVASTDGRQVQWLVMEWWGSATPSSDMVVEVFLE